MNWKNYFVTVLDAVQSFNRVAKYDNGIIAIEHYVRIHERDMSPELLACPFQFGHTIGTEVVEAPSFWDANPKIIIEQYNKSIRDLLAFEFPGNIQEIRDACEEVNKLMWTEKM